MPEHHSATLTLELVAPELETEEAPVEDARADAQPIVARFGLSRPVGSSDSTGHFTVDSFGKAVMVAASFYDQKEASDELARNLGSPEFLGFVVVDVSPASDRTEEGPKRETVRIHSAVRPTPRLSVHRLTLRFKLNWQTIAYLTTAMFITVAGLLLLLGVWTENQPVTAWGVAVVGIGVLGWGIAVAATAIRLLVELAVWGWRSWRISPKSEKDLKEASEK